MINKAFLARQDLQYYSDRLVNKEVIETTKKYCKEFYIKYIKTKDILSKITEDQINFIRKDLMDKKKQLF